MWADRSYPTLFWVNREARAEAARLDGGTWYETRIEGLRIYANLDTDDVMVTNCCLGHKDSYFLHDVLDCDYWSSV